ncbi:MAG: 16S rRNA (cytosine(1402)-N(4))-methyltransferase RsmH, partial [Actinomycetales bacterium]|nr:16S rRNA (cytosine(1402)-N(4))-methyltransferase RsmH [Actinomycetales bacterium]
LGVSSMQLDFAERGFAYAQDGPLDMRMNEQDDLTAADLLNTYTEDEIVRVLRDFGEEKFARRIASAIVEQRSESPFSTTAELVELIRRSIPAAARRTGRNPSKRTFQALRIEINDELGVFRRALADALELLNVGGRIVVLAYHSLEDRIAKRTFAEVTTLKVPRDLPVVPEHMKPKFRLVLRGAEKATDEEIETNPRATSVRLRVVERVAA